MPAVLICFTPRLDMAASDANTHHMLKIRSLTCFHGGADSTVLHYGNRGDVVFAHVFKLTEWNNGRIFVSLEKGKTTSYLPIAYYHGTFLRASCEKFATPAAKASPLPSDVQGAFHACPALILRSNPLLQTVSLSRCSATRGSRHQLVEENGGLWAKINFIRGSQVILK